MSRSLGACVAAAYCCVSASAIADAGRAEALFREGRALLQAGSYAEACPKLVESLREDAATGTALALALCYERAGKTASAWAAYLDVVARARADGHAAREKAAQERAAALEAKLSRLEVLVPSEAAQLDGFTLRRDGVALAPSDWNVSVPLDPGTYVFEARAPGTSTWRETVTLKEGPEVQTLTVALLRQESSRAPDEPSSPPAPVAVATPAPLASQANSVAPAPEFGKEASGRLWKVAGLSVGASSVVLLGLGSYYGLRARSLNDESNERGRCDALGCDVQGSELRGRARESGNVSTACFIAGGFVAASGLVLYTIGAKRFGSAAGSGSAPRLSVTPAAAPLGAIVLVNGTL